MPKMIVVFPCQWNQKIVFERPEDTTLLTQENICSVLR
jgi:hypothetical protein